MLALNVVVEKDKKFNLALPPALMLEFNAIAKKYGPRKKRLAMAAAVLLLVEAGDAVQDQYAAAVARCDVDGGFGELVAAAKAKAIGKRRPLRGGRTRATPPNHPTPAGRPAKEAQNPQK